MTTAATLLELRDVKVERGGAPVLDVPSFSLAESELVALVGPNGSGKSTLLLTLMGLLERARGDLLYRGRAMTSRRDLLECRRKITMVLQEPLLFDTTVRANVAAGLRLRDLPRAEVKRRADAALARLELLHLADRSARKLSGGEARRVSLARALAVEPEALFLDEPFSNLDAPTRQAMVADLERLIAGSRTAVILVSHDPTDAFRLATRFVVMHGGRIVQSDAPAEVMRRPANPFIASFVGMETLVEGVVARRREGGVVVTAAGAELAAAGDGAPGDRVLCGVRPEHVRVLTERPVGAVNVFPAAVAAISSAGPFLKLRLDGAFPLVAYVSGERFAELGLKEQRELFATFEPVAVHLLPSG
jgi:tungstate transport system ATP-binding protein